MTAYVNATVWDVEVAHVMTVDGALYPTMPPVRIELGTVTAYLSTEAAQSLSDQLVSVLAEQQVTS